MEYDIIIVSGYFSPLHIGHLALIKDAKSRATKIAVIVNNDEQQTLKKGRVVMPSKERLEIVKELRSVDSAMIAVDSDATVSKSIEKICRDNPTARIAFGNGGDRNSNKDIPEVTVCEKYGVDLLFGIGGDFKTDSSSRIIAVSGL